MHYFNLDYSILIVFLARNRNNLIFFKSDQTNHVASDVKVKYKSLIDTVVYKQDQNNLLINAIFLLVTWLTSS